MDIYNPNKFVGKRAKLFGVKVSDLIPLGIFSIILFFIAMIAGMMGLSTKMIYIVNIGCTLAAFFVLQAIEFRAIASGKVPHPSFLASKLAHGLFPKEILPGSPTNTDHKEEDAAQLNKQ